MNNLANAFGQKFIDHKDAIRTRTFELGGHTFKVKVPLTAETEAMFERLKSPSDELVEKYFTELTEGFVNNKAAKDDENVQITDEDVVVHGRSMREAAKNKALAEHRITEMFKLLVPEDTSFDMSTITYDMIEELFPFSIQLEVMENISRTITPEYNEARKK